MAMTKYSNVLGNTMSSQRAPVSSNASTPTSRKYQRNAATPTANGLRQFRSTAR